MKWEAKAMGLLLPMVMASALAVVGVKYVMRMQFTELQQEIRIYDAIAVEWSRLQLEQNTWSSHGRIESLARKKLQLQAPKQEQIVYLKP
jgi:cell division protein FtsL